MGMATPNILELSLAELRRMLEETERAAGPDAQGALILRRIIEDRERIRPGEERQEASP